MKILTKTLGTAFAALSISVIAFAAVNAFSLKRTPILDQVSKYKLTASLELMGQEVKMNGFATEKISKVEANGNYEVLSGQSEIKLNVGGQEIEAPESPASTLVYAADGTLLEIRGEGTTASVYRLSNLSFFKDPGEAKKVGDVWTFDMKAEPKTGAIAFKADYKLEAEEKVGRYETIKITYKIKESEGSDPASAEGTMWFEKGTHRMIKSESKWTNAPIEMAPAPINGSVTMMIQD